MKRLNSLLIISFMLLTFPSTILCAESIVSEFSYEKVQQAQKDISDKEQHFRELRLLAEKGLKELDHEFRMKEETNRLVGIGMVSIAEIISLYIVLFFMKRNPSASNYIVNASGLVFIIFGTIFVVRFTEAEAQFTPAIGIIGAVAGYLFGSLRKEEVSTGGANGGKGESKAA